MESNKKVSLAIFASGSGSNADKICAYFQNHQTIEVRLILSNRKMAGVFQVAQKHNIPAIFLDKETWNKELPVINILTDDKIDYIVLAGFLKLIPEVLINHWPNKILNIHPSLLPKYGGPGMYGLYVHQAVKAHNESETGMTIHLVNKEYDKGQVLFQQKCTISDSMTAEEIASEVLKLEHKHYGPTIENFVLSNIN